MDVRLKPLIMWPERENVRKTMPECFRAEFEDKVAVVTDCFEVFIERPSNLLAPSSILYLVELHLYLVELALPALYLYHDFTTVLMSFDSV